MPTCSHPWCKAPFEIRSEDLAILEKASPVIGGKKESIPPPTLCPQCRVQRRMAWRNDRTFYKRTCDSTGEEFVSMYDNDTPFPVFKQDAWHGDTWDALEFGRAFDATRPFFEQWAELRDCVPHWGVAISNCQNSDYCNYCTDEKNCYLDIAAEGNEDCYYNLFVKNSQNCVDCTFVYNSTLLYECIQCYGCYSCRNSMYLEGCTDCAFCYDCRECTDCLLSTNLRGQRYHILNEPHTKESYEKKKAELRLGSHDTLQKVFAIWKDKRIASGIYRDMVNLNCENCTGNNIKGSKNVHRSFNTTDCEDCAYLYDVLDAKDCADLNYSLYDPEASVEVISTVGAKFCAFYTMGPYNTSCLYSQMCQSCSDCFGCVGLKQKSHCIFNKQYSKQEYETQVSTIIAHMRETGEWGQFFPASFSPHGYNETVANEYLPLKQKEAADRGFRWKEKVAETLDVEKTIPADRLPDTIGDISDDITKWAVRCSATGKLFRIVPQELAFYRKLSVPVPRLCPDERHRARNALRNPRSLWDRTCGKCGKAIKTSYDPEKPERVYCEECYLKEVY